MLVIDKEKKKLKRLTKNKRLKPLLATVTATMEEEQVAADDNENKPNKETDKPEEGSTKENVILASEDTGPIELIVPDIQIKVFQPLPDIVVEQHHDASNEESPSRAESVASTTQSESGQLGASPPVRRRKTPERSKALEVSKPLNLPMIREMTKELSMMMVDINTVMEAQNPPDSSRKLNTTTTSPRDLPGHKPRRRSKTVETKINSGVETPQILPPIVASQNPKGKHSLNTSNIHFSTHNSKPHRKTHSRSSTIQGFDFSLGAEASEIDPDDLENRPLRLSMVEQKRLAEKKREDARRKILENEPVNVYKKDHHGKLIRDILPFRRNKFNIPSDREERIRAQLLESQRQALQVHRSKMDQFFSKLEKQSKSSLFKMIRKCIKLSAQIIKNDNIVIICLHFINM